MRVKIMKHDVIQGLQDDGEWHLGVVRKDDGVEHAARHRRGRDLPKESELGRGKDFASSLEIVPCSVLSITGKNI